MKIFVCDDNLPFRRDLLCQIRQSFAKSRDYGELPLEIKDFSCGEELLKAVRSEGTDLVFLDIQMPEGDGLSVAEVLHRDHPNTLILFVSNYDQYVFYSLRFRPFRFLRKDHLYEELQEALYSAAEHLSRATRFLPIINKNECARVQLDQILFAEKEKEANYLLIHCLHDTYRTRKNIKDVIKELDHPDFIKASQSVVVNMNYVAAIKEREVLLTDQRRLCLSASCANAVKSAYLEFVRKKSN